MIDFQSILSTHSSKATTAAGIPKALVSLMLWALKYVPFEYIVKAAQNAAVLAQKTTQLDEDETMNVDGETYDFRSIPGNHIEGSSKFAVAKTTRGLDVSEADKNMLTLAASKMGEVLTITDDEAIKAKCLAAINLIDSFLSKNPVRKTSAVSGSSDPFADVRKQVSLEVSKGDSPQVSSGLKNALAQVVSAGSDQIAANEAVLLDAEYTVQKQARKRGGADPRSSFGLYDPFDMSM